MCTCEDTRISYRRGDGATSIARVSYRCAAHSAEKRARDRAVQALVARMTARMPLALPAPRRLLGVA